MALRRPGQRAGALLRAAPAAPACSPCVHIGGRWDRELAARRSPRPDSARPAVAQSSLPLTETWSTLGVGGVRPSTSTITSGNAAGSGTWLNPCVRHIVTTAGQRGRAPMLHLVFSSRDNNGDMQHHFETVPVSPAVADDPQRWTEFASYVRNSGANGLVLVRPIASPEQHCIYSPSGTQAQSPQPVAVACAPDTTAADATCACCASVPPAAACSPAADCPSAAATEVVEGQVGTCCEPGRLTAPESQTGAPRSARADGTGALLAALRPSKSTSLPRMDSGVTQYYGLVVQSSCSSAADGCWVLKTTSSDSAEGAGLCSCTHFSLTRVCLGQPLYTQLRDAWLVQ